MPRLSPLMVRGNSVVSCNFTKFENQIQHKLRIGDRERESASLRVFCSQHGGKSINTIAGSMMLPVRDTRDKDYQQHRGGGRVPPS